MITLRHAVVVGLSSVLAGCFSVPKFGTLAERAGAAPRVSDIVDEVQCEIIDAAASSDPKFASLKINNYVVSVNLTLDVTNNQGINPSLSYINPYAAAMTNFSASLDAQLTGQQHRNANQTFNLVIDRTAFDKKGDCDQIRKAHHSLHGDLGIAEIIATGLRYESRDAYLLKAIGVTLPVDTSSNPLASSVLIPTFGSTVDFTVIYGFGGGPNWTLTHFNGPYSAEATFPSSGGLLNYLRTNKDTLVLAFAQMPPRTVAEQPRLGEKGREAPLASEVNAVRADVEAAGRAAQENITRTILQRLLIP